MTLAIYQRAMGAIATTDGAASALGVDMWELPKVSMGAGIKNNGKTYRLYKYVLTSRWFTTNGTWTQISLCWVTGGGAGVVTQQLVTDTVGVSNNPASTDSAEPAQYSHEWPEGRLLTPIHPGYGNVNTPTCIGLVAGANQAGVGQYEFLMGGDWDWGTALVALNVFDLGDNP